MQFNSFDNYTYKSPDSNSIEEYQQFLEEDERKNQINEMVKKRTIAFDKLIRPDKLIQPRYGKKAFAIKSTGENNNTDINHHATCMTPSAAKRQFELP